MAVLRLRAPARNRAFRVAASILLRRQEKHRSSQTSSDSSGPAGMLACCRTTRPAVTALPFWRLSPAADLKPSMSRSRILSRTWMTGSNGTAVETEARKRNVRMPAAFEESFPFFPGPAATLCVLIFRGPKSARTSRARPKEGRRTRSRSRSESCCPPTRAKAKLRFFANSSA